MNDAHAEIDRSGTVVAGKYRVEKLIAKGGFSSVYRARQIGMERDVAIKVLEIDSGVDGTTLERFVREARLVSQLSHPNTITIFDFGRSGTDFLYIVMEYVKGRSLSRQVRKYGALHAVDAARVALDILKSLEEAHRLGILHRDMKPSNIMLGRDHDDALTVRVLDFGIAKILDPMPDMATALTQQGVFIGTPRYAAPEQMKREEMTAAADIYGVGMVLWECLVGKPAVEGIDFAAAVEGHLSRTPWRLPFDAVVPPGLTKILYRALEKAPLDRYQSCKEMSAALEEFLDLNEESPTVHTSPGTGEVFSEDFPILSAFSPDAWFGESEVIGEFSPEMSSETQIPRVITAALPSEPIPRPNLARPSLARPSLPKPSEFETSLAADISPAVAPRAALEAAPVLAFDHRNERRKTRGRHPVEIKRERSEKSKKVLIAGALVVLGLVLVGFVGVWATRSSKSEVQVGPPTAVAVQSPSITADGVMLSMQTAGWNIRNIDESSFSDTSQTTMMAEKDRLKATVTIYECDSDLLANAILKDTQQPSESVLFGRTVVRVSPGPSSSPSGVQPLTSMLFAFRGMLEEKGKL
jgi:serine/threonine protein kinase